MVRLTDQEKTAAEKIVFYSQFSSGEGIPCHAETHEEAPGSVERQKERGESMSKGLDRGFCRKEWARQGKQAEQT